VARQPLQTAALGASAPSAALFESRYGEAGHGMAWQGLAGHGEARRGMARTADSSTEGSPSLLFSWEQVWSGRTGSGLIRYGWVRQRTARQQQLSAEGFGFPAGF